MKYIYIITRFLLLLAFMPLAAQNTATANGNWDSCSTWGTPSSGITKGNDAQSAKTINGFTVNMNTNWNAKSLDFVGGNGILDFQGSGNALDLDSAGGAAQVCAIPAVLGSLSCSTGVQTGRLYATTPVVIANGVTKTVPYTGGNGGAYAGQTINSTGVTGLQAVLNAGTLSNGSGTLTFMIQGTPSAIGAANFSLTIGGKNCSFSVNIENGNAIKDPNLDSIGTGGLWYVNNSGNGSGGLGKFGYINYIAGEASVSGAFSCAWQQGLGGVRTNGATLSFRLGLWHGKDASKLEISYNGVVYALLNTRAAGSNTGQIVAQNGASGASVNITHGTKFNVTNMYTVSFTLPTIPPSGQFSFRYIGSTSPSYSGNYSDYVLFDNFFLSAGY